MIDRELVSLDGLSRSQVRPSEIVLRSLSDVRLSARHLREGARRRGHRPNAPSETVPADGCSSESGPAPQQRQNRRTECRRSTQAYAHPSSLASPRTVNADASARVSGRRWWMRIVDLARLVCVSVLRRDVCARSRGQSIGDDSLPMSVRCDSPSLSAPWRQPELLVLQRCSGVSAVGVVAGRARRRRALGAAAVDGHDSSVGATLSARRVLRSQPHREPGLGVSSH